MEDEQGFWLALRQAILQIVDAIERWKLRWPPEKRTAEIRKESRRNAEPTN